MGYSPWGRKESGTTELLSTAQHILTNITGTMNVVNSVQYYKCILFLNNSFSSLETRIIFSGGWVLVW